MRFHIRVYSNKTSKQFYTAYANDLEKAKLTARLLILKEFEDTAFGSVIDCEAYKDREHMLMSNAEVNVGLDLVYFVRKSGPNQILTSDD